MSFRRRLLLLFAIVVFLSVASVSWIISLLARRAFDRANDERTAALVAQFRQEFTQRGDEVVRRIQAAATTSEAVRMAVAAAAASPSYNAFLDDAQTIAESQRLDFLEFCDDRGVIISSAQWPAKFGYNEPLAVANAPQDAFLREDETPSGPLLGLFAVRSIPAGDRKLYVIGGIRLDRSFLSSLDLPSGMRVMLYENLGHAVDFSPERLITTKDSVADPRQLEPLIQQVQRDVRESGAIIRWHSGVEETVNAFPLRGDQNQLLGILLVTSSREIYTELRDQVRSAALLAAGCGMIVAILLSGWAAARVTRPVEKLAHAAQEIADGNWDTNVSSDSTDEIGALADSFNRMTRELVDQRERLIQAERVAAWRDLARRLAHELKNPLFPLQLTVENLLRAREHGQQEFDEAFHESATTLLSEIANLKAIVGRFSEFSKMPEPHYQFVDLNELISNAVKVYQPQIDLQNIKYSAELNASEPIAADPELLHRAVSNLVLNAIEVMPKGGSLSVKTANDKGWARLSVSDTGPGLSTEESARLFTPYYTSKPKGTGLGLAIVQSIVTDHGGSIKVSGDIGKGTTFMIELPTNLDKLSAAQGMHN